MGVPRIATWGTPANRASGRTALPPLTILRGNVRVNQGADLPNSLTQRERMFELTQRPREFHCPQRADSCFPTALRTEAVYTGILVCLKSRFNASVSNTFGEIF